MTICMTIHLAGWRCGRALRMGALLLPLAGLMPLTLMAQTSAASPAKAGDKKPSAASASRVEAKNKATQLATGIKAAEDALTPAEMAIAERVYTGKLPCELGASVTLTPDAKNPGYFEVSIKNLKFHMFPVVTTTGAIRLEDKKAGAVWLQLANKSMLMNHKLGQRLADACMNPAQIAVAAALEKNPGRTVLDGPAPATEGAGAGAGAGTAASAASSEPVASAAPAASAASAASSAPAASAAK